MRLSVIVTTYNQPEWLDLVLCGYAVQEFRDFELIVADDGSDQRTAEVIERARPDSAVPILHIWHEDHGFRKCEILNKAILAASGDILLFTDGDCIPRRDFLSVHDRLLVPGRFLSGGYAKLPEHVSRAISREDVASGRVTDYRWLRRRGAGSTRALLRLRVPAAIAGVLDLATPTRPSFNGHNASAWREDILRVNGFDERMGWGGLDRELGERLENAGVRGLQVRHRAHVVHLHHARGYRKPDVVRANRAIRDETARSRRVRTPVGLDRHTSVDSAIS
ncbi:MAG TPA: glycosyltransferase family 2 protein [Longimicrobiales bacterium]